MRLTYRGTIPDHPPEEVFSAHERPGALERLTPPWANVDVEHKFVRRYEVTDAAIHDSRLIDRLLDGCNTNRDVYADGAYHSQAIRERLEQQGYRDRIHRRGRRDAPLTDRDRAPNKVKSRVRARVDHVFGRQAQRLGGKLIRCVGIARVRAVIGLRNLTYNLERYARLVAG